MTPTDEVPMPEPSELHVGVYGYTEADLRAYADARCAKLQEECDGKQKQIHRRANAMNAVYAELQRVAPWSESNDMDWADEMICGIGLLAQERDALAEKVKALRGAARGALRCLCEQVLPLEQGSIDIINSTILDLQSVLYATPVDAAIGGDEA